ncbi:MAG: glycosyltransferase family 2 protein [Bacteroidota bacterium]
MEKISASIVTYQNDIVVLIKVVAKLLEKENLILYVIDNSPTNEIERAFVGERVTYMHNPSNPGFGAAHNLAITKATAAGSSFHFIINPDIHINGDVIGPMVCYMQNHPDVGMLMPQILNEDGSIQYLPKLLPTPFWIFRRKLKKFDLNHASFINKYELRDISQDKIYNAPILSGCFTLLNLVAVNEIGGYDDKFFMYFEDFDLSRRMHKKYKTIYYPEVTVYHGYEGGANKNARLFKIFVASAITYFNKWGWIFDSERRLINKKTLEQFEK